MAVDFGDHASGFRHTEVIRFINNEVLMNGGGPDFYVAFRSRPWNEVEDQLQTVVADPQVPRTIKRACAWSALALSVRVAARQREQQAHRLRRLQEQVEERETAAWALASELQRLRGDREEVATQLRFTQVALQQALIECDVLRGRLLHVDRSAHIIPLAHEILPRPRAEQHGTIAWPLNAEQQRDVVAMGFPGRLYLEAQVPAPAAVLYMPGPPSPWAQAIQPPLPAPVPYSLPFQAPLPVGIPFLPALPPAVVMDAEAAVVPLQMVPLGSCPPGPCAAVGFREEGAPPWDQRSYSQEGGPEILQNTVPLGNIRNLSQEGLGKPQGMVPFGDSWSHSQEKGTPQGMVSLGDSWSQIQKEGPEKVQGMVPLGESWSLSQKEGPEKAQGMVPSGDSWGRSQKEGLERPQGMVPPGEGWSLSQEDSERFQEVVTLGASQEEDPETPQEVVPLRASESHSQEEFPKRPQGMAPLGASRSNSQEEDAERSQEVVPLGVSESHIQEENPKRPQGMAPLGASRSNSQEEDVGGPQEVVPLGASGSHIQEENPKRPQGMAPLGASRSNSQEEDPGEPQEVVPLGASGSHSKEEGPKNPQRMAPLGASRSNNKEEDPEGAQEMVSLGASGNHNKEEGPERPQGMAPLGDNSSQSQEGDLERPQGTGPLGGSRSDSQEEGPQRPQVPPLGDGWSQIMRENPKIQQPLGQKAKQPKGKKALDSKHQEKFVSRCSPKDWDCPWCKAMNFSWRKSCYKCKKVCVAGETNEQWQRSGKWLHESAERQYLRECWLHPRALSFGSPPSQAPFQSRWMKNKMDSKGEHHAVDGASLGKTNWIKKRTGLREALLRMPRAPSLPFGVFSAGSLLPRDRWSPGAGKLDGLQSERKVFSSSPMKSQLTKLSLCQRFPDSSNKECALACCVFCVVCISGQVCSRAAV
ncbi:testis-expressed protein 13D [Eumetopias jubatus]|uniref:testis-expressed protein 13D n=1 Tax=Eumetopias jubatus TaxID=34886 RepID=UPI001016BEBF|nr:testis-expressed protein 13D [Eumetopias jubatus]